MIKKPSSLSLLVVSFSLSPYLPVDQAHDSGLHPHSHGEAGVHVLMVEQGLEAGQEEQQEGKHEALPQVAVLVTHEPQEEAGGGGGKTWFYMMLCSRDKLRN